MARTKKTTTTRKPKAKQPEAKKLPYEDDIPPAVLNKFINMACKARRAGVEKWSAYALINYIRWQAVIEEGGKPSDYKISNNWVPTMARLAMARKPRALAGFFTVHRTKEEVAAA